MFLMSEANDARRPHACACIRTGTRARLSTGGIRVIHRGLKREGRERLPGAQDQPGGIIPRHEARQDAPKARQLRAEPGVLFLFRKGSPVGSAELVSAGRANRHAGSGSRRAIASALDFGIPAAWRFRRSAVLNDLKSWTVTTAADSARVARASKRLPKQ
jgi:hypothetical protein